ncbi:MAG: hypothetical protein JXA74_14905 [Anaerolineae bacterium]|nr:hypothetical protein [Anaerolineae bacterium]
MTLRQLQPRGTAFDLKRLVLTASSPAGSALRAYFTHNHLGTPTYVRDDLVTDGRGFVQVKPRPNGVEWDLLYIAPSLDDHKDVASIWHGLLGYLIILAGQQGVLRIYARSPEDAEIESVLRSAGFSILAREEVFVLSVPATPAPHPKGMRRAGGRDREALICLCQRAMPSLVRKAELSSGDWCQAVTPRLRRQMGRVRRVDEFICMAKGQMIAYLSMRESSSGYWLEVIVHPEYRGDVLPYVRYILTLAECSPSKPLYCGVPDFGVGLGWILRTLAFEPYARQALLVAHTVARVPVRPAVVIPGLEGGVESFGRQV